MIESNPVPVQSVTHIAHPEDHRCRYWCKVVTAEQALPLPSNVDGANAVPGAYLRKGDDVEVFAGDFVLEGEAVHHAKQRGWTYNLFSLRDGKLVDWYRSDTAERVKAELRARGERELLRGSGDVAAMIRMIHFARKFGYLPSPRTRAVVAAVSALRAMVESL